MGEAAVCRRPRKRWATTALIVAASVAGGGAALAQQAPLLAGETGLAVPDAGQRLTRLDATFDVSYDSNVARASKEVAALRGLSVSDETFEPQINAELARPIGRETIFLSGHFGYLDYARNTVLNSEDIKVIGGAEGRVAFCDSSLAGTYSRAQTDLLYYGLVTPGGTPASGLRNDFQDVGINFAAACGHTTGFAPTVTVTQNWYTNSSVFREPLNADTTTVNGGLAYRNHVLGTLNLFGQYTYTNYPDRILVGPAGPANLVYQITGAGVSYTRMVGSRLSGTASLSYVSTQPNLGLKGYSGINYGFDMAYALTQRIGASFRFGRTTLPSNAFNASYILSDVYSVAVSYKMGPRINWKAGVGRVRDQYGGLIAGSGGGFTDDTYDNVYGSVDYVLGRHFTIGLATSYAHRDANLLGLGYSENRIVASFRAAL